MLCWREQNGFFRRTIVYSELLEAMKLCTNEYNYSKEEVRDFRFGIRMCEIDDGGNSGCELINDDDNDDPLPKIIQKEIEDEPIDQIIPLGLDLILVPLVLIPKDK